MTHHYGLVRYGLLKTTGQAEGFRVLKVKKAYYAIQNAVSIFNDDLECISPKTTSKISDEKSVIYDWVDRKTGTPIVVFWDASERPSDDNITRPADVTVKGAPVKNPVWVDVLTGNVYKIDSSDISTAKESTSYRVPVYDSPAFITSMDLLTLDYSWYVREGKNNKTN